MSTYRQAPANDDKCNPRKPEMRVMEVDETGGMIMMAHYDDARLNPNNHGNNSTLSPEQANTATGTANTSTHAAKNPNFNETPPLRVRRGGRWLVNGGMRILAQIAVDMEHASLGGPVDLIPNVLREGDFWFFFSFLFFFNVGRWLW